MLFDTEKPISFWKPIYETVIDRTKLQTDKKQRLLMDIKYFRYDKQLENLMDSYKLNDPET